ncbi:hypothetical protein V500_04123 [Pseudogymnoascus sp. VKM F-4518 (FW-2643)]|nr:hypothetical protein V500_04123 [Pseudogymnoascus sp. VKM F-4518 (FW-2643)]
MRFANITAVGGRVDRVKGSHRQYSVDYLNILAANGGWLLRSYTKTAGTAVTVFTSENATSPSGCGDSSMAVE